MHDTPTQTAPSSEFAATVEAGRLLTALESVGALVDECRMTVDGEGLSVAAVDPAAAAMVDLSLPASAFESFEATDHEFGVNLVRLVDVVGMADGDRAVRLDLAAATGILRIRVGELDYALGLIAPETIREPPGMGDLPEAPAGVSLPADHLDRSLRAADTVADCATLRVDADDRTFSVSAAGDTDDVRYELPARECASFEAGDAESTFSLTYLTAVEGAVPAGATVDLALGPERPIEVEFALPGGGRVEYLVAPRTPVDR